MSHKNKADGSKGKKRIERVEHDVHTEPVIDESINRNIVQLKVPHRLADSDNRIDINQKDEIEELFNEVCGDFGIRYKPAIFPAVPKIIAFGDIHGDYGLAIEMLEIAKLVTYDKKTDKCTWIGGSTYVVQVGDQIDMCRFTPDKPMDYCNRPGVTENDEASDTKLLELFTDLDRQAGQQNGAVISLLGNHELLNVNGDMRYVSYENIQQFDSGTNKNDGKKRRAQAFAPCNLKQLGKSDDIQGKYARLLGCTRYPAVIIGSNIFVHAGIIDGLIELLERTSNKIEGPADLEKINIKVRMWLLGLIDADYVSAIINSPESKSLFWTRVLGKLDHNVPLDSDVCQSNLSKVLKIFHLKDSDGVIKMIIGHTPQSFLYSKNINATCGDRIWRVDNGSSKAFDSFDPNYDGVHKTKSASRETQFLKIENDNTFYVCTKKGCVLSSTPV